MGNNGCFKKGHKLSKGRPPGSPNKITRDFLESVRNVEEEKKMSLYEHYVRTAFKNDTVLISLMKKLLPDRRREEKSDVGSVGFFQGMVQKAFDSVERSSKKYEGMEP